MNELERMDAANKMTPEQMIHYVGKEFKLSSGGPSFLCVKAYKAAAHITTVKGITSNGTHQTFARIIDVEFTHNVPDIFVCGKQEKLKQFLKENKCKLLEMNDEYMVLEDNTPVNGKRNICEVAMPITAKAATKFICEQMRNNQITY